MHASVTVHMNAPADEIWELISDVRNTGKFSPETFEAEWLDGATGPAVGAKFRGHVRRNEIGPVYWTTCRVTSCEPGRDFGQAREFIGTRAQFRERHIGPVAQQRLGQLILTFAEHQEFQPVVEGEALQHRVFFL